MIVLRFASSATLARVMADGAGTLYLRDPPVNMLTTSVITPDASRKGRQAYAVDTHRPVRTITRVP